MSNLNFSIFGNKRNTKPQPAKATWQKLCKDFTQPQVRLQKDGWLFSPATFEPAYRLNENVRELSMLVLDIDHNAELETLKNKLSVLDSTYTIYSTHSHLRKTDTNPNAEPRYRVLIPLCCPIPTNDFPGLWQYAKHITGLPLDESAKDASRMFYMPAIASRNAPYEVHTVDGKFLDWRKLPLDSQKTNNDLKNKTNSNSQANSITFEFHEDRQAELCRRIETQAKATGRGTFEMKCPAHNSKGNSSLFYDPKTKVVACLNDPNKCSYFEILAAFDLPSEHLPSREHREKISAAENAEFTNEPKQNEKPPLRPLKTVKMSEVKAEKVEWLWNPFIPLGTLTLIDGEEGIGKSLIALQGLGVAVATGKRIDTTSGNLVFTATDVSSVLIMSAEESLSFVVKPRLQAVDAPCERFVAIDEPFTLDNDGIIRLSMAIEEHEPKLVIIDPLFSYTGKVRLNDDNEIRSITDPLTRLAEKFGCAIVGIRHINKSKGFGDARNAGLNGVGWRAAARSALLVGIDKETGETAIVQTKTNLSEKSKKAFGYKIESAQIPLENGEIISAPKLSWTGESDLTAETMLSALRSETSEEKSEKQDAIAFLREALKTGQKTANAIFSEAKKIGISEATLKRAKATLGVKSVKRGGTFGGDNSWFWEMPITEDAQLPAEDAQKDSREHLQSNAANKASYNNSLAEDAQTNSFEHLQQGVEPLQQKNDEMEYFD
jgi:RecA-family ATPase